MRTKLLPEENMVKASFAYYIANLFRMDSENYQHKLKILKKMKAIFNALELMQHPYTWTLDRHDDRYGTLSGSGYNIGMLNATYLKLQSLKETIDEIQLEENKTTPIRLQIKEI